MKSMLNPEGIVTPVESTIATILKDYWHVITGFGATLWALFELRTQQKQNQKDISDNRAALDKHCEKSEENLVILESKIGLRITDVERNQDKLLELIYREQKSQSTDLAALKDLVQEVRASANKTEGYLQAQKEFNVRHDKF